MWFGLLAAFAFTLLQANQDARPLLQAVADASRNLTTYRAEGRIEQVLEIGIIRGKPQLAFRVEWRAPRSMRIEVRGGEEFMDVTPLVATCDGPTGWVYYEKRLVYDKVAEEGPVGSYCTPGTLTSFERVANDLISAVITGLGTVEFEGRTQPCTEVEARYRVINDFMVVPGMVFKVGRVTRTMCIDTERKLILRDRIDADLDAGPNGNRVMQTVTYQRIERNPTLPGDLFEFQPPPGSKPFEKPTLSTMSAPPAPPPAAIPSTARVIRSPEPVATIAPEYTQEAWDEGIQGTVVLHADVAPDGTMLDVRVRESLGFGLDEKAIECVRKWRFRPATDSGTAIKGTAYIQVRFSLPPERPARPSSKPVSRPARPSRPALVELTQPTDEDSFFHIVAVKFKAPAVCARIRLQVEGQSSPDATRGYQVRELRSSCYAALATLLKDGSLCERVSPVSVEFLDGSKYDKADCLNGVGGSLPYVVGPNPFELEPLVRFMRKMGYDDHTVANWKYRQNPEASDTYAAYEALRTDQDFLARLSAAPTYSELRSQARLRNANALEFLYQMVAVDSAKPEYCERVSPNATFVELGERTALLRSRCFLSLAFNSRQSQFCDELPATGSFPHINNQYDSLESCQKTVAIYQCPDFKSNLRDGPSAFPDQADFEAALRQLGYPDDYVRSRVPPPTPELYWDFLFMMSLHGDAQQKADLVRRVLAM